MKKIDVIVFGGQSNMQGQTERLTNTDVVENALEYRYLTDTLVPLCNPVGENIKKDKTAGYAHVKGGDGKKWLQEHVTGWSAGGNTNMVPEFCKAYIRLTGTNVAAVHVAKGSTQITDWIPGTVGFELIAEKTKLAMQKLQPEYQVDRIYFVWLQGESDAIFRVDKQTYIEHMLSLNSGLKEELGIHKFGVIRVGRFAGDDRDQEIIDAQEAVCENSDDFTMLTRIATELNKMPQYMNPEVSGHYSAEGQELLGKTAGEALAKARLG